MIHVAMLNVVTIWYPNRHMEFYGWLLFIHVGFEQFFIQLIVVLIVNMGNFLILLPWF